MNFNDDQQNVQFYAYYFWGVTNPLDKIYNYYTKRNFIIIIIIIIYYYSCYEDVVNAEIDALKRSYNLVQNCVET